MNILVLGADGTGKSEVCQELQGVYSGTLTERRFPGRIPIDAEDAYTRAMEVLLGINEGSKQLWNRFYFPDDLIYGKVIRKDPPGLTRLMGEVFLDQILPLMVERRFRVFLLTASWPVAVARGGLKPTEAEGDTKQEYQNFTWEQWYEISQLYWKYVRDIMRYVLPTQIYDTEKMDEREIAQDIRRFCITTMGDSHWKEGKGVCGTLASCLPS